MADIIREDRQAGSSPLEQADAPNPGLEDDLVEIAELLFFAYRDFISDPDVILNKFGFGRAHHRVVHFVYHHPGLRVADLLDILNITKQSLARVLKQLIDEGFITQREGETDRRERLLFVTEQGRELASTLIDPQLKRISKALDAIGREGEDVVREFLYTMIGENERTRVAKLLKSRLGKREQNGE